MSRKKIALGFLVIMMSMGMVTTALANPSWHDRNGNREHHEDSHSGHRHFHH
jgi:hypothetical protein